MTTTPLLLLVEDHDLVLEFLQCMFLEAGYAVTAVSSGVAALAALKADARRFCAVVTDIHLGSTGPSGWEIGRLSTQLPKALRTGRQRVFREVRWSGSRFCQTRWWPRLPIC
jgi:CheY-like chemotaxis protein